MQEQKIVNQMIALSDKKLDMLVQLKELSVKQKEAFRQNLLDNVEKILDKKDEVIKYIGKLDNAFIRTSDALKTLLGIDSLNELESTDIEGRKELKELIGKITILVEEIINIEKHGFDNALKLQQEFGKEIKNINAGKKLTNAYNTKPLNNPSYFFDKKK